MCVAQAEETREAQRDAPGHKKGSLGNASYGESLDAKRGVWVTLVMDVCGAHGLSEGSAVQCPWTEKRGGGWPLQDIANSNFEWFIAHKEGLGRDRILRESCNSIAIVLAMQMGRGKQMKILSCTKVLK